MARHRALDPLCPFVTSPNESGNVPIMSEMGTIDLMNEQSRLATFKNWTVSPAKGKLLKVLFDRMFGTLSGTLYNATVFGKGWFLLLQPIGSR